MFKSGADEAIKSRYFLGLLVIWVVFLYTICVLT